MGKYISLPICKLLEWCSDSLDDPFMVLSRFWCLRLKCQRWHLFILGLFTVQDKNSSFSPAGLLKMSLCGVCLFS